MEKCSLLVCANSSYIRAEEDLQILTGVKLGHSTLHRQVEKSEIPEPKQGKMIHTVSADGGKIKIRSMSGGEGEWRDYKAVSVDDGTCGAYFQENEKLQKWVNEKRRWSVINCLGDGHDGIWGLFEGIATKDERRELTIPTSLLFSDKSAKVQCLALI